MDLPNEVDIARKNLCRLPEDVLSMMILKNHVDAKLLLRISMASKQFATLVSDTDSLILHYELSPDYNPSDLDQIIAGLTNRFQKLQHLHIVDLQDQFHPNLYNLMRCQASVGSDFELGYVLFSQPHHHQTLTDDSPAAISSMTLNEAQQEYLPHEMVMEVMESNLGTALNNSRIIRRIVSKNIRKFKSIAISDPLKSWMVFMGEEEIGRSRNKPAVDPIDMFTPVDVTLWDVPLLNLPALGYALTDVKFFAIKPTDKPPIQQPDVLQKCVWSNYDKDWTIFREARKEIMCNNNLMKQKTVIRIAAMLLFGVLNPVWENFYSLTLRQFNEIAELGQNQDENVAEDGNPEH